MKKTVLALALFLLVPVVALAQSLESNLIDAVTLYGNGQYTRARDILHSLSVAAPENDAVWYYLAQTQWQTSDKEAAEASLKKAIALDSTNFWYRRLLGRMYLSQNKIDEGEGQNHGTGNLAAHFRIAGNAFHGALKAETHTKAATAGADADAESSAEAGGAEGGGVKGGAGSKGHGGNAEQGNHVKSDEKIFTHWNTP